MARIRARRRVRTGPINALEAQRRHSHVIRVAGDQFLAKGFSASSLDVIAKRSRVSKATLYKRYGGKEALFRDFIAHSMRGFRVDLEKTLGSGRPVATVVRDVVRLIVATISEESALGTLRLVVAERRRFPKIASMVLVQTEELLRPLEEYLRTAAKPPLARADARRRSLVLMNMAVGGFAILLSDPARLYGPRATWAEQMARIFLDAFPAR